MSDKTKSTGVPAGVFLGVIFFAAMYCAGVERRLHDLQALTKQHSAEIENASRGVTNAFNWIAPPDIEGCHIVWEVDAGSEEMIRRNTPERPYMVRGEQIVRHGNDEATK